MADNQQYSNHARFHPPFHFALIPLLLVHFLYSAYQLVRNPDLPHAESVLLATALLLMAFLVRINPLRAQDRLIRLEETLRYRQVLPPTLAEEAINNLSVGQMVALRFASDAELAEAVKRVLAGELRSAQDIKKSIRQWRGDYFRV